MTTVTISPGTAAPPRFHAVAGGKKSEGATPGEALDRLTSQLDDPHAATLVFIGPGGPDEFFTAQQQGRLSELYGRLRSARDEGTALPPGEQDELDALIDAEQEAAVRRTEALVRKLR
ncbi:MAG: hypothetical protein ACRC33_04805 [Gemmataceae bacterium]